METDQGNNESVEITETEDVGDTFEVNADDLAAVKELIRETSDAFVVRFSKDSIVFRKFLYASDMEALDLARDENGEIQQATFACELAMRLCDQSRTRTELMKLPFEDADLLQLVCNSIVQRARAGAREAPEFEEGTFEVKYPLRRQTEHEARTHGEDNGTLTSMQWRAITMGDLVRSESAGATVTEETARLLASVTKEPWHRIIRMDFRDFSALRDLANRSKKNRSIGQMIALQKILLGTPGK